MSGRKNFSATAQVLQGTEAVTLLAAQGVGTRIHVQKLTYSIILAATGAGVGKLAVEDSDGGDRFVEVDAEATQPPRTLDYGDFGFQLGDNNALIITVDAATTNEATARVTAVGYITGV